MVSTAKISLFSYMIMPLIMLQSLRIGSTEQKNLVQALCRIDFFAGLTPADLDLIFTFIQLYYFKAGDKVFKKGDTGDALYIVHEGQISIIVKSGFFSPAKVLATLGPGDFFGEMALLDKSPRTATALTEKGAKLFVLLREDFESVARKNPSLSAVLQKIAARRRFETQH